MSVHVYLCIGVCVSLRVSVCACDSPSQLKCPYAEQDNLIEWEQKWFIFQHSLLCDPYTSKMGIAVLGSN